MKLIAPLTFAILATPMAAMAGGPAQPVVEAPVAAPAPVIMDNTGDWNGFYSNLELGGGNFYGSTPGLGGGIGAAGLSLGYRKDLGTLVVGGEVSWDKDNINQSSSDPHVNNTAKAKLILGADLGKTLVYGSVGVARADADFGGASGSDTGYTFGIGADYALNQQWTVGGELSTDRYSDFNGTGSDLKDTSLMLKVGMRF